MAWENVNYSCGHAERQQFYGHHTDREAKREWMERGVCPDCFRAQKEEEKKQENERAASLANEIGFAPLTGSDKQIAWAQSIRQKKYEALAASLNHPNPKAAYALMAEAMSLETSAKWWIDKRDSSARQIMEMIAASYPAKTAEINNKSRNAREEAKSE